MNNPVQSLLTVLALFFGPPLAVGLVLSVLFWRERRRQRADLTARAAADRAKYRPSHERRSV